MLMGTRLLSGGDEMFLNWRIVIDPTFVSMLKIA